MRPRPRLITLSTAHFLYLGLTFVLLGGVVWISAYGGFREVFSRYVTMPPLAQAFGFSLRQDRNVGWMVVDAVTPGGVFDRVGIRPGDIPLAAEHYGFYNGLPDFLGELEQAQRGSRVELVVKSFSQADDRPEPLRCVWIDLEGLRTHPTRRFRAIPCGEADFVVRASVAGYGFLWPASTCCAFDLTLRGTLDASLKIEQNTGTKPATRNERFRISESAWKHIGHAIWEAQFFDLPAEVGDFGVDGPVRTLYVSHGDKSHTVHLGDCGPSAEGELAARACAVWAVVTSQIPFPEVTER